MTQRADLRNPPSFTRTPWQMTYGERFAFEGILTQLKPNLAIEIGTAEGGSLARIADHSAEVHSFDLIAPKLDIPSHVTLHGGDSHVELPKFLKELADADRSVDFVLVDGDHTADGVRQDLVDLLESEAVTECVILIHDTTNEEVREGVEAVDWLAYPKVAHVELDMIPGALSVVPGYFFATIWGGLGLVVVSESGQFPKPAEEVVSTRALSSTRVGLGLKELLGRDAQHDTDVAAAIRDLKAKAALGSEPHAEVRLALKTDFERSTLSLLGATITSAAQGARRRIAGLRSR